MAVFIRKMAVLHDLKFIATISLQSRRCKFELGGDWMNYEGLDTYDNAILKLIKNDARMSYSDIGQQVGLSRPAVKNRMLAMQKKA